MACQPSSVKFQLRRATASNWTSTNPILKAGEPGFETDTYKLKIGDGINTWRNLPYTSTTVSGPTGGTGPQGIQGIQGVAGNVGPTGSQGIQGVQGTAGQSFTLLGSYADITAFNNAKIAGFLIQYQSVGNAFILLSDGSLMTWSTTINDWFDAGDIKGPQGVTGPQGVQGIQGIQGVTGPQGVQGIQGIQGIQGLQGVTGPQGLQGVTGPQGVQGTTGAQGIQGDAGIGSNIAATYYSLKTQPVNGSAGPPTVFSYGPTGNYSVGGVVLNGGGTQIVVPKTGIYEAWYSMQLHSTVSREIYTNIWIRKNGVNVPDTNGRIQTKSNTSDSLPIVPYILPLNAGDYIEFVSQTNDTNGHIQALAVLGGIGGNIPSIIVGIKQIATDIGSVGPTGPTGPQGPQGLGSTTGSWTLSAGANTVSLTVPGPGTYSIWVNGNIPNGIVTYTATVVVTNSNVPVVGSQYGWYYLAGNALVLTSIPSHVVGTLGGISTASPAVGNANIFTFGITNNSGSSKVVNWGYLTF
jgi:hypothetical protein